MDFSGKKSLTKPTKLWGSRMKGKVYKYLRQYLIIALLLLLGIRYSIVFAQPVPPDYKKCFFHYVDKRSYVERILDSIGLTNNDLGRSFALIAGVSACGGAMCLKCTFHPFTFVLRYGTDRE